jgi:NAD-dependent deacetylase
LTYADQVDRAAALLREAEYAVALTGAGISTPSGIPDFRSPGEGLWEQDSPLEVASLYAFLHHPRQFYRWIRPLARAMVEAEPNPGHRALAELEAEGLLQAVITQNIDGLHQEAGSEEVIEVHGHPRESTCLDCGALIPTPALLETFLIEETPPICPDCAGRLKPNVVLFGEVLPVEAVEAARAHVRRADLMLVAGSSLEVVPVSSFPRRVYEQGGDLVVINWMPTYVDDWASVVIRDDVAAVLPRLVRACKEDDNDEE